jgi:hypothetical protein
VLWPTSHYPFHSIVTRHYQLDLPDGAADDRGWHRKRLSYSNPSSQALVISLHTDRPELLQYSRQPVSIPPHSAAKLALQIRPPPPQTVAAAGVPQRAPLAVRLWIHDEVLSKNVECVVLNVAVS